LLPDDQVHPDTHALTMVNNVIEVVNYMIAARPSLLNYVIADIQAAATNPVDLADPFEDSPGCRGRARRPNWVAIRSFGSRDAVMFRSDPSFHHS
jgi:hypothetical protein